MGGDKDMLSYAQLFQILSACININEVFVSHPHRDLLQIVDGNSFRLSLPQISMMLFS